MSENVYDEAWRNEQIREIAKAYRGCTHLLNRSAADYDDCWKAVQELRQQNEMLQKDREADRAKIGELQAQVSELTKRMDKAALFAKEQAKQGKVA